MLLQSHKQYQLLKNTHYIAPWRPLVWKCGQLRLERQRQEEDQRQQTTTMTITGTWKTTTTTATATTTNDYKDNNGDMYNDNKDNNNKDDDIKDKDRQITKYESNIITIIISIDYLMPIPISALISSRDSYIWTEALAECRYGSRDDDMRADMGIGIR